MYSPITHEDIGVYMGTFIVVEGFDGAGKSTYCTGLASSLREKGLEVVECRQPGGTPIAERLRGIVKDVSINEEVSLLSEYLIMSAARQQLWFNVIKPALAAGKVVISDRHVMSSFAYQNLSIGQVESLVCGKPDFTIFLDVGYAKSMGRLTAKGESCRIEQKGDQFLSEVHGRYQAGWDALPKHQRLRIDSNDFKSQVYLDQVELSKVVVEGIARDRYMVTASVFERQVYDTERVRVIIKQDVGMLVPSYLYKALPDSATIGDLTDRIKLHLDDTPHVIAAALADCRFTQAIINLN